MDDAQCRPYSGSQKAENLWLSIFIQLIKTIFYLNKQIYQKNMNYFHGRFITWIKNFNRF